jgi:hypothetical protein
MVSLRILAGTFFLALGLVGGVIGLLYFGGVHGENTPAPDPVFSRLWGGFALADAALCLVAAVRMFRAAGDPEVGSSADRLALAAAAVSLVLLAVVLLRSEPR